MTALKRAKWTLVDKNVMGGQLTTVNWPKAKLNQTPVSPLNTYIHTVSSFPFQQQPRCLMSSKSCPENRNRVMSITFFCNLWNYAEVCKRWVTAFSTHSLWHTEANGTTACPRVLPWYVDTPEDIHEIQTYAERIVHCGFKPGCPALKTIQSSKLVIDIYVW